MREAKAYCNQIWIDIVDTSDHGKEAFQDKMPFLLYLPDREFDDETKRDCEEEERLKTWSVTLTIGRAILESNHIVHPSEIIHGLVTQHW